MSTVDAGLETQLRNIEEKYGKSLSEWVTIIRNSGKTKHTEIVAMLKSQYGMAHGAAHRISLKAREADSTELSSVTNPSGLNPVVDLYDGKKAQLRPVHDALMESINKFGNDIEIAPKKGYVSLRRRKQFAMIQPTTTTRIDVGLILKNVTTTPRLEPASSFNALFTHRVRVSRPDDINEELIGWLKQAYDLAG